MHEETRTLGEEEHAEQHDGGEDERRSKDVSPVARDLEEDGGNDVSKDLSEGNVELVEGDEVSSDPSLDSLGDVDGNSTAFETDTETKDNSG